MPLGTCGLCGRNTDLQDSHLLPKSIYRRLRKASQLDGEKNPNPVVINPEVTAATSQQVTDYFLCKECEHLLNVNGEKWMAERCWQPGCIFPLRHALNAAPPVYAGKNGVEFYEAATIEGVDVNQIVYFAASVFWRAAAHEFGGVLGATPEKLELGPYEESLRQYLLGDTGFPTQTALIVTVSAETDDGANEVALFPFLRTKKSGAMQYGFAIPGVGFQLFVGESTPPEIVALSLAHAPKHLIVCGPFDGVLTDMAKLFANSKRNLISTSKCSMAGES